MRLLILIILVISTFKDTFAEAQRYPQSESQRIEGYMSMKENNRLRIAGDRILEVIGLEDEFLLESDDRLGQIFIKANGTKDKAVFTVVTEKGKTQDFMLRVRSNVAGQTILVESGYEKGSKHARHDELVSVLKLARGFEPNVQQDPYVEDGLQVTLLTSKKVGSYTVEVWSLQNKSYDILSLTERQFASVTTAAVMLDKATLSAGAETILYRVEWLKA